MPLTRRLDFFILFALFSCIIATSRAFKAIMEGRAIDLVPSEPKQTNPIKILTGPVIGKVTTTTARVLIEFDTEMLISAILTDPQGNKIIVEKKTKAMIPVVFAFQGLQPNITYNVGLNDPSINMTESYFTTLSGEPGKLNFAVVSCNYRMVQEMKIKNPEEDLWLDLLRRIRNKEIQYLLQIGDQVYVDGGPILPTTYERCMMKLNNPRDQWEFKKQEILEMIRNEYRLTWSVPSVKEVLSKIPSLTILDDHDIRDNWGAYSPDTDPYSAFFFYGGLARQVYYEYERQLREDVDFDDLSSITEDYYYEIMNDIGFFFLDYRGTRTWNQEYSQMGDSKLESKLGKAQTELLQQLLDPKHGEFADMNNLFVVSSLAVIEPGEEGVPGEPVHNVESWGMSWGIEQANFMDILRRWRLAKKGRELTVIGGDTHMGGYTDVMYNGQFAFLQFVSSSIASFITVDAVFEALGLNGQTKPLIEPWAFQHYDWTNKHNYGIVFANYQVGQATVDCYLVEAKFIPPPPMIHLSANSDSNGRNLANISWKTAFLGVISMILLVGIY